MSTPSPSRRLLGSAHRRLVVLRHGVTEHNAAGIWQGHLDTPLSEAGREQGRSAAPAMADFGPARILSSDLSRAAQTACFVGELTGVPVTSDQRLREIHVGQWQGRTVAEVVAADPGLQEALANGDDMRRGGDGETVAEVAARVRACIDDLLIDLEPEQTAVIVTHGVAARALVADLVGLDQRLAWTTLVGLDNCAWAVVEEFADRWRLQAWNVHAPRRAHPAPAMSRY